MTRLQQFLFKDANYRQFVLPFIPTYYFVLFVSLMCVKWHFSGLPLLCLVATAVVMLPVPLSSLATPQTNPSSHLLIDALSDHYNISAEQQTAAQSNQFCASALSTHGSARLRGTSFGTN